MSLLWIVVGAALILDALIVWFTTSLSSGVVATCVIGVLYLLHGLHRDRTRAGTRRSLSRWVKVFVPVVTALALVLFASIASLGRTDTVSHQEDAVIVLGGALKGEDVTPALRSRLDVAVGYSVANPGAVIVVAGGQGPGESVTEALAMERYLISHEPRGVEGVDVERLGFRPFQHLAVRFPLAAGWDGGQGNALRQRLFQTQ